MYRNQLSDNSDHSAKQTATAVVTQSGFSIVNELVGNCGLFTAMAGNREGFSVSALRGFGDGTIELAQQKCGQPSQ